MIRSALPALFLVAGLSACSPSTPAAPTNDARNEWPVPEPENAGAEAVNNAAEAEPPENAAAAVDNHIDEPAEPKTVAVTPPRPGAFYHARGTEPFWAVSIYGGTLMLERPDAPSQHFPVSRDGNRYSGEGIQMTLAAGPCSDGMSDRIYPEKVQIALSGAVLKGCGGEAQ